MITDIFNALFHLPILIATAQPTLQGRRVHVASSDDC